LAGQTHARLLVVGQVGGGLGGGGRFGVQSGGAQFGGEGDQAAADAGHVGAGGGGDLPVGLDRFCGGGAGLVGVLVGDVPAGQDVQRLGEDFPVAEQGVSGGGSNLRSTSTAVRAAATASGSRPAVANCEDNPSHCTATSTIAWARASRGFGQARALSKRAGCSRLRKLRASGVSHSGG
jgi:hypothetical protein